MGLSDLFRPKHRHSDPKIRAQAVRQFGEDDAGIVAEIARNDEHPGVRKLALEKLHDASVIAELARRESDAEVKALAVRRASELWLSEINETAGSSERAVAGLLGLGDAQALSEAARRVGDTQVRARLIDAISDEKCLAELARKRPSLASVLLVRIRDQALLRQLAVEEQNKELALAAVERVDIGELDAIANKASNKAVRARARKRLEEAQPPKQGPSPEQLRLHAERVQLGKRAEAFAHVHEWIESLPQVDALEAEWLALPACEDAALQAKFTSAIATYRARRERYGREMIAANEAAQRKAERAEKARQRAAEPPVEAAQAELHAAHDVEAHPAPVEPAASGGERSEAKRAEKPERPARASDDDHESVRALLRVVEELEVLAPASLSTRKAADQKLKQVDEVAQAANKLKHRLHDRFRAARAKLFVRVQELREADDWQKWANLQKREQVLAVAKQLAEAGPVEDLGAKLQELQAAWKEIGAVPHEKGQELWNQFKAVCDGMYEHVREQRKVQDAVFEENLSKKAQLCERAEALRGSTEWETTAEEIKKLQAEWKAIGPVPRKQADAIWQRFRTACDDFFERRKPHLQQALAEQADNLKRKLALCAAAEAAAQNEDADAAATELRKLQRQWNETGRVPRQDARTINERFRTACDGFFTRRKDEAARKEYEAQQAVTRAHEHATELSAAISEGELSGEDLKNRVLEVRSEIAALEAAESSESALLHVRQAFYDACRTALERDSEAFRGSELDVEVNRRRKEKLLERANALLPKQAEPLGEATTAEQMAERLRKALSENALRGQARATHDLRDQISQMQTSWLRLGPLPGADGRALDEQFAGTCERVIATAG